MVDTAFTASREFLENLIEKYPENERFIDLYARLIEFKSEYDLQLAQLNKNFRQEI